MIGAEGGDQWKSHMARCNKVCPTGRGPLVTDMSIVPGSIRQTVKSSNVDSVYIFSYFVSRDLGTDQRCRFGLQDRPSGPVHTSGRRFGCQYERSHGQWCLSY